VTDRRPAQPELTFPALVARRRANPVCLRLVPGMAGWTWTLNLADRLVDDDPVPDSTDATYLRNLVNRVQPQRVGRAVSASPAVDYCTGVSS
jgi:hypothetical protein